jgi:DNA-binding transcriptional ArsR family regulator
MKERANELLPEAALAEAAECLRVMAHPLRLRMVEYLMQADRPVNAVAKLCGLSPAQTCGHLRLLKGHGLLASERKGRTVYYRIASAQLPGLIHCIRRNCDVKGEA